MAPSLKKGEIVLFTGNYDIANNNVSGSIISNYPIVQANPTGTNVMSVNYFYFFLLNNPVKFINETYELASYTASDYKIKNGEISWSASYPDPSSQAGISTGMQRFIVLGKSGIYEKVCYVDIDFTNPQRVIYFVGKKC